MATTVAATYIGGTTIKIEIVVLGFKIIIMPKDTTVRTSGGDNIVWAWGGFNLEGAVDYIYEYSGRKN